MLTKHYFCPIPFNIMKMKNLSIIDSSWLLVLLAGCGKPGKSIEGIAK